MTDDDLDTFRERIPVIATMIEAAFNGDRKEGEHKVGFVMLAFHLGDNDGRATMISNNIPPHEAISAMLTAIAQFETVPKGERH